MSLPQVHLYYNGTNQKSTSGKTFPTTDPSTGEAVAHVHTSSEADIDAAVSSAESAFPSWSTTPPAARARILLKAVDLLRARNDELAEIETRDTGKPWSETSTVDVVTGADSLEYFANLVGGGGLNGETVQLRQDAWVHTRKEALGVCVGIGAWNYPLQIALWKSAPCLAAGNTMVYKPSEFTPLHASRLAAIYSEAGLPAGVFNVVQGDGHVGRYLVSHPKVAKVSFTGQVSTGRNVAAAAAKDMKYVTMELGGKSPLIVLPDCDLETAVDGAMMANFFSSGQVCTNGTRVFVPDSMLSAFEGQLVKKMEYVRMGATMDSDTNFGPLVSAVHLKRVQHYIQYGKEVDKARVLYDGRFQSIAALSSRHTGGYWCPPVVFTDCTDSMKITTEEIFGPVMCILPYSSACKTYVDDLVARANATPLGLAAGVFGKDLITVEKIIGRLQAGITWINTWGESPAEMSVGGWKMSGVGVENGRRGIEAWVRNKSTLVEMGGKVVSVFEKLANESGPKAKL